MLNTQLQNSELSSPVSLQEWHSHSLPLQIKQVIKYSYPLLFCTTQNAIKNAIIITYCTLFILGLYEVLESRVSVGINVMSQSFIFDNCIRLGSLKEPYIITLALSLALHCNSVESLALHYSIVLACQGYIMTVLNKIH